MTAIKLLSKFTAFAGGFALAALLFDDLLPLPEVPQVSEGLAWLDQHREECDTVFIGSSRIRWQLDPQLFDRIMREDGHPVCSYNFGVEAAWIPELSFLLDQLLRLHLPKLRFVVIDLNPLWRGSAPLLPEDSLRSVYWHDWRHTLVACETAFRPALGQKLSRAAVRGLVCSNSKAMLIHYSHCGRGELSAWLAKAPPARVSVRLDARGYFPLAEKMSAEEAARHQALLATMITREPLNTLRDPVLERELAALSAKIEAAGAVAIFLRMPFVAETRLPSPLPNASGWPLTLSFDDPRQYPALYDAARRHDIYHLNTSGAEDFTSIVAKSISAQLDNDRNRSARSEKVRPN